MLRATVVIVLLMYAHSSFADVSIYTIEGQIQAVFPAEPKFMGEAGSGNQRHRSYQAIDIDNVLFYSVTWQIGKTTFSEADVLSALRHYADGDAIGVNGIVTLFNYVNFYGNKGTEYIIEYTGNNLTIVKYSSVFYKNGQFYSWSVQEIVGMSHASAKDYFRNYVKYFKLVD